MSSYVEVDRCRICGGGDLKPILSLGIQALTGIFPRSRGEKVAAGPLDLAKCAVKNGCGLVQLRQSYNKRLMYADRYGYRSGLNPAMVSHLQGLTAKLIGLAPLRPGDLVVDIGSNDGTLLKSYPLGEWDLAGVDPTAAHFKDLYPPRISLIPDFFSAEALARRFGGRKARLITSIAMFYDLDAPMEFVSQVAASLAPDGIWLFEQSYLPAMIEMNAYDTICHEHLEYYALAQVKWMLDRCGMKIVDLEFNSINGGSFAVTAARREAPFPEASSLVAERLAAETLYTGWEPYGDFRERVQRHRDAIREFFTRAGKEGRSVAGYGASTKGNVILQYCGLSEKELPVIGEVNREKFGCFTPGSLIPIAAEDEVRRSRPDLWLVLPWHFRSFIVSKEAEYLRSGGRLVFPLPQLELVAA